MEENIKHAHQPTDVKQFLLETFVKQYQNIVDFINKLPIQSVEVKSHVISKFYDGYCVIKEQFLYMNIMTSAPPADNIQPPENKEPKEQAPTIN